MKQKLEAASFVFKDGPDTLTAYFEASGFVVNKYKKIPVYKVGILLNDLKPIYLGISYSITVAEARRKIKDFYVRYNSVKKEQANYSRP